MRRLADPNLDIDHSPALSRSCPLAGHRNGAVNL